jgi:sugar phosphate permease
LVQNRLKAILRAIFLAVPPECVYCEFLAMSTFPEPLTTEPGRAERPTRVRHLVVFVTVLMAVILYLDRYCVSFAERYIKEDLALSEHQMAMFISAFFWAYGLAQVPAGWLGDRLGSRGVLAIYIVSWSFFTAMIGWAAGAALLISMRFACGLGQAGAYPTSGSLLSRWVPFSRRGFASGLVALGGRAGAVIAPILTAGLMVLFVPDSTPAQLTGREILNGPALCARLLPRIDAPPAGENSPPGRRIVELLPDDAHWIVVQYGTLLQNYERVAKAIESESPGGTAPTASATVPAATSSEAEIRRQMNELRLTPDETDVLAAGLNDVLRHRTLFAAADFAGLKNVEREALALLERRQRGHSLSDAQAIRFNRLGLEALFPAEIGKLYVKGWRPVLFIYGLAGFAIAGIFWFCFRNSPAEHPLCNVAEQSLISGDRPQDVAKQQATGEKFPAQEILRSGSLWLSSVSQFTTNAAWLFFVTWLPRYLMEVHQVPIVERSWMVSIPSLAGIAGMFLGGHLTDLLARRMGLRWGRALPMGLTRFFAAGAYLACLWIDSPWAATAAFALGYFFVDLGVSAIWAYMQDVGGKNVGAILGWGNMWGNFGAAVAPHLYDAVLGTTPSIADWNAMFVVCAVMFVISGVTALGIDATVPITRVPARS